MSTILETVVKNTYADFETATTRLLDELAEFIQINKRSIIQETYYYFSIKMSKCDESNNFRYKCSFAKIIPGKTIEKGHKNVELLVFTILTPEALAQILRKKYKADVSLVNTVNRQITYLRVSLPFM